jgi:hypothetical protein
MANPTTNYGFVLPTSTDLVTDLPADFDVALQGVDTRLKALQPGTTLGDLAYSSATANTNTRLPIGTTGQVLSVAGGVPTWAAPAGGGQNWSLLNAGGTALTGASTITVSGISAKNALMIITIGATNGVSSAAYSYRLNADSGANYNHYGTVDLARSTYQLGNFFINESTGATSIPAGTVGANSDTSVTGFLEITGCNASGVKVFKAVNGVNSNNVATYNDYNIGGFYSGSSTISSVSILASGGNFTGGTIYVYATA